MHQMAQKVEISLKKKKSAWAKIGIAILILLLIPIVLGGLLYLYVNVADFQYDDPQQVLSLNVPMSFSQRNSFDADSSTHIMRLDNADVYYLTADKMPDLNFSESVYISAYRIALEDEAVYLQGKAYGINLPIKLGIEAGWENGNILLRIRDAYLGKWYIPVPMRLIAEKLELELEYGLSVEDIPSFKAAENLYIKDGYLQVTFPVDKNFVKEGLSAWLYLKPAMFYLTEEDAMVMLVNDYQKNWTEEQYTSERFDAFMKEFQQNPDKYQELKVKILAAGPEKVAKEYFSPEKYNADSMARFYPGITPQTVEQMRGQLHYERNYFFLKKFASDIDKQFGNNVITIRKGRFVNKKSGKVLEWSSFYEDAPEAEEVFPEGTKFCAIFTEGADSRQKIGTGIYASGTAVQFLNGRCAVICYMRDNIYITDITSQEYEDLASGKTSGFVAGIKDK